MFETPEVHCPRCGWKLSQAGPLQNDTENSQTKRLKMKCGNCGGFGSIWEVTLENGFVAEIKFLRSLFRDFDHR